MLRDENTFDELGRITQIEYPGGWLEIMTYFEPGHLKTLKSKKGATETTITMVYDAMYRLIKRDFASGTDTEYEWDAATRVTKMKDASGEKRYYYDDADRLTKVEQGPTGFVINTDHNYKIEYTWNAASQCTAKDLTVRTKSTLGWINTFTVDGQLDTVTNPDDEDTAHLYLSDGRLKKITLSTGSTREIFYQDTDSSHAYVSSKNKHLRKTLDKKSGGTVICSYDYELDPAGNRLSVTDKDSKYIKYGLDPKYQLTSETQWSAKVPGTRNLQYAYVMDANGNRLFQHKDGVVTSYTIGDNNEVTNISGIGAIDYDHYGSVIAYSDVTLTYDYERHMTHIEDESNHTDDHEYDGNGRRMRSKLNGAANWTHFIHDELTEQILCEYTLISSTFTIKSVNTYGIGLISTNRDSGTKRYFHFDGAADTVALTDSSQVVQDSYAYSAFGVSENSSGSSTNPFRFLGQFGCYDDSARGSVFGYVRMQGNYYLPQFDMHLGAQHNKPQPIFGESCSDKDMELIRGTLRELCKKLSSTRQEWLAFVKCIAVGPDCIGLKGGVSVGEAGFDDCLRGICNGAQVLFHCCHLGELCGSIVGPCYGKCAYTTNAIPITIVICPDAYAEAGCDKLSCIVLHELLHFCGVKGEVKCLNCVRALPGCGRSGSH